MSTFKGILQGAPGGSATEAMHAHDSRISADSDRLFSVAAGAESAFGVLLEPCP